MGNEVSAEKPAANFNNDIKFIVKPDDGIVIGIYQFKPYVALKAMRSQLNKQQKWALDNLLERAYDTYTIKAVAKCAPNDEFSEEFGKKLVEARIFHKCHLMLQKQLKYVSRDLMVLQAAVEGGCFEHMCKAIKIKNDINEYFFIKE